jgi:hypothetical protein
MAHQMNLLSKWTEFEVFIQKAQPVLVPACFEPYSSLAFNPAKGELQLFIETRDGFAALQPPTDMAFTLTTQEGRTGWIISTARRDLYPLFYAFACLVVDGIVRDSLGPSAAFERAVKTFEELIQRSSLLSEEKQIGLIGELLVLRYLALHRDWGWCLDAWHDESNAEHDFNLGTNDIEVKSTLMESRKHTIGSAFQLQPTSSRSLFLASFQFTQSEHPDAIRLPGIVRELLTCIADESADLVDRFKHRLRKLGYREEHESYYRFGLIHRTEPTAFAVDASFPRIVPDALERIVDFTQNRVSDVSYRINLDGLMGTSLTEFLATQLEEREL